MDDMSHRPTNTVMIRNLDLLSTEDSILLALEAVFPSLVHIVKTVYLTRDTFTCLPRGIFFIETNNMLEADALVAELPYPLQVDGMPTFACHCDHTIMEVQAMERMQEEAMRPSVIEFDDTDELGKLSAEKLSKTHKDFAYNQYCNNYYTSQIPATCFSRAKDQLDAVSTTTIYEDPSEISDWVDVVDYLDPRPGTSKMWGPKPNSYTSAEKRKREAPRLEWTPITVINGEKRSDLTSETESKFDENCSPYQWWKDLALNFSSGSRANCIDPREFDQGDYANESKLGKKEPGFQFNIDDDSDTPQFMEEGTYEEKKKLSRPASREGDEFCPPRKKHRSN